MNYRTWMATAKAIVAEKLAEVGHEDVTVTVSWNGRYTAKMGSARITSRDNKTGLIQLSKPLWGKASEAEQRETVVHELAHILDFLTREPKQAQIILGRRGWRRKRVDLHGYRWQTWMLQLGYPNPSRTHNVAAREIQERRQRKREARVGGNGWMIPCTRCGNDVRLGPRQYSMARRGTRAYTHRGCGGKLDMPKARPR